VFSLIGLIEKSCFRYLWPLKSYVRNKAQPEGSIVEGYLAEEVLSLFCQYMEGVETRMNRPSCVDDSSNLDSTQLSTLFPAIGRVVSASSTFEMSTMERTQTHRYVLFNCPKVKLYIEWVFLNCAKLKPYIFMGLLVICWNRILVSSKGMQNMLFKFAYALFRWYVDTLNQYFL